MPSITTWTRLEPRTRNPDIETGLQARVYDPLWLLGRQLQLGELQGEMAGSAVAVHVEARCAPLSRYHPGPLTGNAAADAAASAAFDTAAGPLEETVEGETVALGAAGATPRLAVTAGMHFLRLLAAHGAGGYRQAFIDAHPFGPPDPARWPALDLASRRWIAVLAGRAPDGAALYDSLAPGLEATPPALPAAPAVRPGDRAAVLAAAQEWRRWYEGLLGDGQAPSTWDVSRMEYRFAVSAKLAGGQDVTLEAPEFDGGRLDWDALDVRPGASLGAPAVGVAPSDARADVVPSPVRFRGMASGRFWQFDDGRANLAAVSAGLADSARVVMLEFALVYGGGWMLVPLQVPAGSMCQVTSLTVTNTFGQTTVIPHYSRVDAAAGRPGAWRVFAAASAGAAAGVGGQAPADLFLLPPLPGPTATGELVEEVLFLRDEMAAMAWAVERLVEGPAGRAVDRFAAWQARLRQQTAPAPAGAPGLAYRLATTVPEYWAPMVPVSMPSPGGGASRWLRLGELLDVNGAAQPLAPVGSLLTAGPHLTVHDEEVPRAGVRVTRSRRYARWTDGSTRVWLGRDKLPGRGEGSSGLRFDVTDA